MKRSILLILSILLLLCAFHDAEAQEKAPGGLPMDVYYLMPSFTNGTVYFRGKGPAQGKLNICAVDNTLRFLDNNGKELAAGQADNIYRVKIDTAVFMFSNDMFYRMYPVSGDMGIALKREVQIIRDQKQGAYGTVSRTESIREYNTIYADGVAYDLRKDKEYPYKVSEYLFIYKGDDVFTVNKKNLRKLFPEQKAEIDAWFKDGGSVPDTVDGLKEFLRQWAQ